MLDDSVFKENIDGEALLWAHDRLMRRLEPRRILLVYLTVRHATILDACSERRRLS